MRIFEEAGASRGLGASRGRSFAGSFAGPGELRGAGSFAGPGASRGGASRGRSFAGPGASRGLPLKDESTGTKQGQGV